MFGQFWAGQLGWNPMMFVPVQTAMDERGGEADDAPRDVEQGGDELVVVRTCGAWGNECFVLQRRNCYWAILEARPPHRNVA